MTDEDLIDEDRLDEFLGARRRAREARRNGTGGGASAGVDATDPSTTTPVGALDEVGGRRRFARDNLSVASGTLLSRLTGLARLGALYYAAGPSLRDAYLLANNTPNIIYELILGGILTATLVPLFTDHLEHHDGEATDAVVSVTGVALVGLTVLTVVLAPLLMLLYSTNPGPGVDPEVLRRVGIQLSVLFAPQVLFYGAMALGSALLNARRRFFAAAWAPVVNNAVAIAVLVAVGAIWDGPDLLEASTTSTIVWTLGVGTTAGIVAMATTLWPALRRAGVRLHFRPDRRHPAVRKALALSGWTVGYVVANQVAGQIVNVLAEPGSGGPTTYQTAFMFFQLPHGLLAVTLMTTFQPDLARAATRGDEPTFSRRLLLGLRLLLLVVAPAAVGYLVLPLAVLNAPEHSGLLDATSPLLSVGDALAGFALGLVGFSLYLFALRGFYARKDTRTPFAINCIENGINVVLALMLVDRYGVTGLAVAYAIAYTIAAAMAMAVLIGRLPSFDVRGWLGSTARTLAAAAAMGVVAFGVGRALTTGTEAGMVVGSVATVATGLVIYAAVTWLLRLPQQVGLVGGER